jgi:hypothetical protein
MVAFKTIIYKLEHVGSRSRAGAARTASQGRPHSTATQCWLLAGSRSKRGELTNEQQFESLWIPIRAIDTSQTAMRSRRLSVFQMQHVAHPKVDHAALRASAGCLLVLQEITTTTILIDHTQRHPS